MIQVTDSIKLCELGQAVVATETKELAALKNRINGNFAKACELILACNGRVIITGIGKSGHIGHKIAATLASTGTPAFFVHPAEASHGDLGMIMSIDVVIAISSSGETEEVIKLLPLLKRFGTPLIAMCGKLDSSLARTANVTLDISVSEEACPLGLAPTSSTTVTLVMGDALAIALLKAKGFTVEDFALHHPGGNLGKRLLLRIDDIMRTGNDIPKIKYNARLKDALIEMTVKCLGMTTVLDENNNLVGIYTDGDLRRSLNQGFDVQTTKIADVMTKEYRTVRPGILAAEALNIMQTNKITSLMVLDDNNHLTGVIHMHDLLATGLN